MKTSYKFTWLRVSKTHPCKICNKPDWCTYSELGACCMRVQSNRTTSNGGHLHYADKTVPYIPLPKSEPKKINAYGLWNAWYRATGATMLENLGQKLGVSSMALSLIGCVWAQPHNAYAFPMYDADGNTIGLRLRNHNGQKWAVAGSRQGVFLSKHAMQPSVMICEGPTDTAAAVELGFSVIGRPSCAGCHDIILGILKRKKVREVIICADGDGPGLEGAGKLQKVLPMRSCLFIPPCKDLREMVNFGGTSATVQSMVKDLIWVQPHKSH